MGLTIEAVENRVSALKDAIEKSFSAHNALIGRAQEAEDLLKFMKETAENTDIVEKVAEAIEATEAELVEEA